MNISFLLNPERDPTCPYNIRTTTTSSQAGGPTTISSIISYIDFWKNYKSKPSHWYGFTKGS